MLTSRFLQSQLTLPNGKVLVASGYPSSSAELYDPAQNTWGAAGDSGARFVGTLGLLPGGQDVLFLGGQQGGTVVETTARYNIAGNSWTPGGAANPQNGQYANAVVLPSGQALLLGGVNGGQVGARYDSGTDSWTTVPTLSIVRSSPALVALPDGTVLVAGGDLYGIGGTADCQIYHPDTNTFTPTAALSVPHNSPMAVMLNTGKVLLVGGDSPVAELYDPGTGLWSVTGSVAHARIAGTLSLFGSGRALLVGGFGNDDGTAHSTEVYDPGSGQWLSGPDSAIDRQGHSASELLTGQILVTGGHGNGPSTFTELFSEGG
jgi:N-acetylneuraminic acid mutarotase